MNISLGIDLGASAVKYALINEDNLLLTSAYQLSFGRPLPVLLSMLASLEAQIDPQATLTVAISGNTSALLSGCGLFPVNEIAAIRSGIARLYPAAEFVIEIGGQNSKFLSGLHGNLQLFTGSNCAAGTGSFLEDQMSRLNMDISDYSACIKRAASVPRIAGRCSVFSKTDIIHHGQQGVPADDILLGLAYAVVRHYKSAVAKNITINAPVAFIGGTGFNLGIIQAVREIFHLREQDLFISQECGIVQALGTAILAKDRGTAASLAQLTKQIRSASEIPASICGTLPPLPEEAPRLMPVPTISVSKEEPLSCALGVDVGSTSTNLVLLDTETNNMIDSQYLRTAGNPLGAVMKGLASIQERLARKITICAVGTTGSGREYIGRRIGADCMRDEITAQATAALHFVPEADTVFEIGGQDSKYIRCSNGEIKEFEMNKICAAGTGAFIEEQAARMGLSLTEFYTLALQSEKPLDLGERCTVFIESAINREIAKGQAPEDITAGLCHAIVSNYLSKVVGDRPVGSKIVFLGGLAFNPAIVGAFRSHFGDRLVIPEYFSVSGAVGAALLANAEIMATGKATCFKGYPGCTEDRQASPSPAPAAAESPQTALLQKMEQFLLGDYTGVRDPRKKTIGIPRALTIYRMFPLFYEFFSQLGYNVLLSSKTDDTIIRKSQEYTREETCYPVKLMHGHMAELAEQKVDYIFMPRVHTMKHEISRTKRNFGCVYMQTAPVITANAIGLEERGIELLSPVLSMELGKTAMADALVQTGTRLGHSKPACAMAAAKGAAAFITYGRKSEQLGQELLKTLAPDEIAFVIITRPYGVNDPCLNMNVEGIIAGMGYQLLHLDHLPGHDIDTSGEYPNLYWPFGQHILSGAELIRQHPNLYAVYLTNHGCGPDTILAHLFREQMEGKPYLSLEVDEHVSPLGIITRIEAFVSSIKGQARPVAAPSSFTDCAGWIPHKPTGVNSSMKSLKKDLPVFLPYLYPYSQLLAAALEREGYLARSLPPTTADTLAKGKELARTKEYFTFTSLAGDILTAAARQERSQYLIWQTEGAEADGQYPYVIQSHLNRLGFHQTGLTAPFLEQLPLEPFSKQFFLTILAGDMLLAINADKQGSILLQLCNQLKHQPLDISVLQSLQKHTAVKTGPPDLLLCGDPSVLYNALLQDSLQKELHSRTAAQTPVLQYSPLSEYLLFLWQDALNPNAILPLLEIAGQVGFGTELAKLQSIADRYLPSYNGANGRYRLAKMISGNYRGLIQIASQYENTGTILELMPHIDSGKHLSLGFDGTFTQTDQLKLQAFLYYL